MDTTYYIKKGRRYVPVLEEVTRGALSHGDYLVRVKPGLTTWTRVETDARAEVASAAEELREEMLRAMREANVMAPEKAPLTPEEQEAFKALYKVVKPPVVFRGASLYDIIDAGIRALRAGVAQR